jgi:hypothetical protein
MRGKSRDYITLAEKLGHSEDVCTYVKCDVGMPRSGNIEPTGERLPNPDNLLLSYTGGFTLPRAQARAQGRRSPVPASLMSILDDLSLEGSRAVVTGGSGDIGLAVATLLASAGASVASVDLPGATPPAGIEHIPCDLADREQLSELARDLAARPPRSTCSSTVRASRATACSGSSPTTTGRRC